MRLSTHLCFDGQCQAAFETYQRISDGTIATRLTYGQSPMAVQVDKKWHGRIAHAALKFGDDELTGVDVSADDYKRPQGFFVSLNLQDTSLERRVFESRSEGGELHLPFQATFRAPGFGVLTDKFGVPREVNNVDAKPSV